MATRPGKTSKRPQLQVRVGKRTHPGMQRPENQDCFGTPEGLQSELQQAKGQLYVVADGMGGHAAGQLASKMAVQQLLQEYYGDPSLDIEKSLVQAIQAANFAIHEQAQIPSYAGMGTTLVAAVLRGRELYVANVGDSRAYLVRGRRIKQVTKDHSWVAAGLDAGILTEEEARQHPRRNVVTRSLGTCAEIEIDIFRLALQPEDTVLLCSDGLTGLVGDQEILKVIASRAPQEAANVLIDLANKRGGLDNVTAIVINVTTVPGVVGSLRRFALPVAAGLATAIIIVAAVRTQWSLGEKPEATTTLSATPTVHPSRPMTTEQSLESRPAHSQRSDTYMVQPGDTLWSIAPALGISWEALAEANGLSPPYLISEGQELIIPPSTPTPPPAERHRRPPKR